MDGAVASDAMTEGVVDAFIPPNLLQGWVRVSADRPPRPVPISVRRFGREIGRGFANTVRDDMSGALGFLVATIEQISLDDLSTGRIAVSAISDGGTQFGLGLWSEAVGRAAARAPIVMPNWPFLRHLEAQGVALHTRAGTRLRGDIVLEPPCTVLAPDIGGACAFGAYTGLYGTDTGRLRAARIGRFCSIANGFVIGPDEHPLDWLSTSMVQYVQNVHGWDDYRERGGRLRDARHYGFVQPEDVTIGNDVWIGANVFVRAGVRIGDGAVVAAGAVVVRDVPPYAIVGGNPARVIRLRFDERVVERLLALRWWEHDVFALGTLDWRRVDAAIEAIEDAISRGTIGPLPTRAVRLGDLFHAWCVSRATGP
jgi:acetyltransferase-like isoleucine patch superfamily enzyme